MAGFLICSDDALVARSVERLLGHFGYDAAACVGNRAAAEGYDARDVIWVDEQAPFRAGAVLDRLEAMIVAREASVVLSVGARYALHAAERLLVPVAGVESDAVKVTDTEIRLLKALAEAGDDGMSRDDLLQSVWGMRPDLDTHTVETHIYRLRQKLEVDPAVPEVIVTVRDGYALRSQ